MTGNHRRNTGPMLASRRCGAKTRSGEGLQVAGSTRQKAMSDAWWRAGIGRAEREQERAKARPVDEGRARRTETTPELVRQSMKLLQNIA